MRCSDHEMYFAPPATTAVPALSLLSSSGATIGAAPPVVSDADRLLRCAASVSSLALQRPSLFSGASAAGNWMSPQERSAINAANVILHRLTMKNERTLQSSGSATSFAGARTSMHRLQTAEEVTRSHISARGIEAGDPGAVGLLRRLVSRLPGIENPVEGDTPFVARAAHEAGQRLAAFMKAQPDAAEVAAVATGNIASVDDISATATLAVTAGSDLELPSLAGSRRRRRSADHPGILPDHSDAHDIGTRNDHGAADRPHLPSQIGDAQSLPDSVHKRPRPLEASSSMPHLPSSSIDAAEPAITQQLPLSRSHDALREQKKRWACNHNSGQFATEAASGSGITMAQKHASSNTTCLLCGPTAWETPDADFSHLHFMQCVVCKGIVCGTGTEY